jgi:hypothetical protein
VITTFLLFHELLCEIGQTGLFKYQADGSLGPFPERHEDIVSTGSLRREKSTFQGRYDGEYGYLGGGSGQCVATLLTPHGLRQASLLELAKYGLEESRWYPLCPRDLSNGERASPFVKGQFQHGA